MATEMFCRCLLACGVVLFLATMEPSCRYATGLQCWKCNNWDNHSQCLEDDQLHTSATKEDCNQSLAVDGKQAFCLSEIIDECQPMVCRDTDDKECNGGRISKRWFIGDCVYVNPNEGRLQKYKKCYWERVRLGRDIIHKKSGFMVLGRSNVKRICYCSEDLCNKLDGEGCQNRASLKFDVVCGPGCRQASRDQLETPGKDDEEFRDSCPKPKRPLEHITTNELQGTPTERMYDDCDKNPNAWEIEEVGGLHYRHNYFYGHKDGVRGQAVSTVVGGASRARVMAAGLCGVLLGRRLGGSTTWTARAA